MRNVTHPDAGITADDVRLALRIWTDYCHTVGLQKTNPRAVEKQAELLMLMRHGVKDAELLRRVLIDLRDF
jgi:hypothetical protein